MNPDYNPFSLEGKIILVVGASSGIGKEIAIACSKMGATVIVAARREDKLKETLNEMHGEGHSLMLVDMTREDDIQKLVESIPVVDGIVVSAGKGHTLPIQFCSKDKFIDLYNLNLFSHCELSRLAYKQRKIKKGGAIVFISSVSAFVTDIGNTMYGTTKAALNAYTRYAALEFAPRKIRVNTINPGMVNTPLIAPDSVSEEDMKKDMAEKYPLKRYGEVQDIAPLAIYLLSDASSWVTGQSIIIDGGRSLM